MLRACSAGALARSMDNIPAGHGVGKTTSSALVGSALPDQFWASDHALVATLAPYLGGAGPGKAYALMFLSFACLTFLICAMVATSTALRLLQHARQYPEAI